MTDNTCTVEIDAAGGLGTKYIISPSVLNIDLLSAYSDTIYICAITMGL